MDGNKTRFRQPQTAPESPGSRVVKQVFPGSAFSMFAAKSLPCRGAQARFDRDGRGKTMKRLFATTWAMALILSAVTILHAQTATPGTSDTRRATRITVGGDSIVQAQPDTARHRVGRGHPASPRARRGPPLPGGLRGRPAVRPRPGDGRGVCSPGATHVRA